MRVAIAALACAAALLVANTAPAQCLGWTDGFNYPTVDGEIYAVAYFNDGTGNALYLGGIIRSAGELRNQYLLRWSGNSFSLPSGGGVNGPVSALRVHEGRLIVGGKFDSAGGTAVRNVASYASDGWDGLEGGTSGPVYAILPLNGIVVGGAFDEAGGVAASNIAQLNDAGWTPLGAGVDGPVLSLEAYDGIVAGGLFRNAGGAPSDRIARWSADTWTPLGSGASGAVRALRVSGASLLIGGDFTTIGGTAANRIASWNGALFSPIGDGFDRSVRAIQTANLDGNVRIIAGGYFEHSGAAEVEYVAWFNGTIWQTLGTGLDGLVHTLSVDSPAPLKTLTAGTSSFDALQQHAGINGPWNAIRSGGGGAHGDMRAALLASDGSETFVAGQFSNIAGVRVSNVAAWNGSAWNALGGGVDAAVDAMAERSDGSIVVAGTGPGDDRISVQAWNGSSWSPIGSELHGRASAMVEFGGELFLSGIFAASGGSTPTPIQRLVGGAWVDISGAPAARVLAVLSPTGVPALYAGGTSLYRYDAGAFVVASDSLADPITSLALFDDGTGAAIYAGGLFRRPANDILGHVVRLNGTTWERVGDGLGMDVAILSDVYALTVHDAGSGPVLFALGSFRDAGGQAVMNAARWDGQVWSRVEGIGWAPLATAGLPNGETGLLVGGAFPFAGDGHSSRLAVLGDVPLAGDLNGDGAVELQDLATLLANFSRSGDAEFEDGDIDGDQDVDLQDLALLLSSFGAVCG